MARLARPGALWAALLLLTIGCVPRAAGAACRTTASFASPGPRAVGVETATFVDGSRPTPAHGTFGGSPDRTLVTEIWYPATVEGRSTPLDRSGAPYPLVVHAHALLDSRTGESYLARHLASHGYVVAAIDFPSSRFDAPGGATVRDLASQPGDVRFVLARLLDRFQGAIDAERVGASGLSLGATTTLLTTYARALREPRVAAALAIAPPYSCALTRRFFRSAHVPLLVLQGDADLLVPLPETGARVFARARGPRHLVVLHNASHLGFVGFAESLPQAEHFDRFGCAALEATLGEDVAFLPLPGDRSEGIDRDPAACPLPCRDAPVDPALGAVRQHELARVVAVAFFDAYLKHDRGARCFLRRTLARENTDVRTRRR